MKKINDDGRKISGLIMSGGGGTYFVGYLDVIEIIAYEEYGQGSMVPWFYITRKDKMTRVNAMHVAEVHYERN